MAVRAVPPSAARERAETEGVRQEHSHLTDEEFAELAELNAKALGPTVQGTSQNGPQNQIESKPAIEAESVDSEAIEA